MICRDRLWLYACVSFIRERVKKRRQSDPGTRADRSQKIASAFAKANCLDLILRLFKKKEPVITPEIYKELLVPITYGYSFPHLILQKLKVIYPIDKEMIDFQKMLSTNPRLGRGELEAITLCKSRGYGYAAIDRRALKFAKSMDIVVFPIDVILRLLWMENVISKAEVRELIVLLEEKDKLKISDVEKIFEDT